MHNSRQMSSNLNPLFGSILGYQLGDIIRTTQRLQSTICKVQGHISKLTALYPRYLPAKVVDIPKISINSIQTPPRGMMKPKTKK